MLYVINHKPRTYSLAEANLLQRLGTVVMRLLSLHLLQQPTWNQHWRASVYAHLETRVTLPR